MSEMDYYEKLDELQAKQDAFVQSIPMPDGAKNMTREEEEKELDEIAEAYVREIIEDDRLSDFLDKVLREEHPYLFEFVEVDEVAGRGYVLRRCEVEELPEYELFYALRAVAYQHLLFRIGVRLARP